MRPATYIDRQTRTARVLAARSAAIERGRDALASAAPIDASHPLTKAVGQERAAELVDGCLYPRQTLARERRDTVARLSREGRTVREIAADLGLSYNYVVELRAELGVGRRR